MTGLRSEDMLVGLVALALVPLIAWRIYRGLRDGRLPLYRTFVGRTDAPSKFNLLLALHALSLLLVGLVAVDLLAGLGVRNAL